MANNNGTGAQYDGPDFQPDYGGGGTGEGNVMPDLSDSFLESAAKKAAEMTVANDAPKK